MNMENRNYVKLEDEYYFYPLIKLNDNDIRKINTYIEHYKNNNVNKIQFIIRENFYSNFQKDYIIDICFSFSKEDLEELGVENMDDENEVYDCTVNKRGDIQAEIEEDLFNFLNLEDRY